MVYTCQRWVWEMTFMRRISAAVVAVAVFLCPALSFSQSLDIRSVASDIAAALAAKEFGDTYQIQKMKYLGDMYQIRHLN